MSKLIAGFSGFAAALFASAVFAQANAAQQIAQCRAANQKAHAEVVQMFQKARAAGQIDPREAQAFQAAERRLSTDAQMLSRGGLTLAECQQIGKEIASERANVQRMAASGRAG